MRNFKSRRPLVFALVLLVVGLIFAPVWTLLILLAIPMLWLRRRSGRNLLVALIALLVLMHVVQVVLRLL